MALRASNHSQFDGTLDQHPDVGAAVREADFLQDRRAALADEVREQGVAERTPHAADAIQQTFFIHATPKTGGMCDRRGVTPSKKR